MNILLWLFALGICGRSVRHSSSQSPSECAVGRNCLLSATAKRTTPIPPSLSKIYVALDACHMIKVLRNLFADLFILNTPDGKVQWQHIKDLVAVQEKGQLHLGNKLTKHHINYKTQIMKVKLAVQVISQSTADALTTLRESGYYTEFKNSTPTTLFLKVSFRRKTCNIHCAALCISET